MKFSDDNVTSLRYKPPEEKANKSNIILTINNNGDIIYWHSPSGKILHKIKEDDSPCLLSLDYNSTGSLFAIGGDDKIIRVYDENMKIISHKYTEGTSYKIGHRGGINSVCFHKNDSTGNYSNIFASGGSDKRVIIYDTLSNKGIYTITGPVLCGDSIDMKDHILLTGNYGNCNSEFDFVQLWDLRTYKMLDKVNWDNELKINSVKGSVYAAQFLKGNCSGKKDLFAIGSYNVNAIRVYDMGNENNVYLYSNFLDYPCYTLDFSHSGENIAFGCSDGKVRIIDL
jgi:WD40 repeat protein